MVKLSLYVWHPSQRADFKGTGELALASSTYAQRGIGICRKSARQRKTAIWIRESLLALGPTFIKIGQLFSTRSDLLSAAYTEV